MLSSSDYLNIKKCESVLLQILYENDVSLTFKFELIYKLQNYLLDIGIDQSLVLAITKLILCLRSIESTSLQDKLSLINLTIKIPALCPVTRNAILESSG